MNEIDLQKLEEEETKHQLLLGSSNIAVVRSRVTSQTYRELPGLANAEAPMQERHRIRPQWAVELMQKLDTTPLADLESELGGGDIVWLKTTSTVGQALFFLRKFRVTGAPVFKNDDCWGMLELADLMAVFVRAPRPSFARVFSSDLRGIDSPWEMHLDDVIDFKEKPSAFLINSSFFADSLVDAFRTQWRVGLYSKNHLECVVSQTSLARLLAHGGGKICGRTTLLGAGLIVSPVYTCDLDDRAGLVMAAMSALKINAVAATDAKNLFKGVLSTHALLSVPDLEDLSLSVGTFLQKVENEEQEPVLTCGPRDSVAELLKKFASGRAHRVFVLDHKVVIGVITLCSLFRCMFDATVTHQNGNMAPVNILK